MTLRDQILARAGGADPKIEMTHAEAAAIWATRPKGERDGE